jgi:hypothetical protein
MSAVRQTCNQHGAVLQASGHEASLSLACATAWNAQSRARRQLWRTHLPFVHFLLA